MHRYVDNRTVRACILLYFPPKIQRITLVLTSVRGQTKASVPYYLALIPSSWM